MRLLKIIVVLVILAVLGLTAYAYLGDMGPRQQEMRKSVPLNITAPTPSTPPAGLSPPEAAQSEPATEDAAEAGADANDLD